MCRTIFSRLSCFEMKARAPLSRTDSCIISSLQPCWLTITNGMRRYFSGTNALSRCSDGLSWPSTMRSQEILLSQSAMRFVLQMQETSWSRSRSFEAKSMRNCHDSSIINMEENMLHIDYRINHMMAIDWKLCAFCVKCTNYDRRTQRRTY